MSGKKVHVRTHNMFVDMGEIAEELASLVGIGPAFKVQDDKNFKPPLFDKGCRLTAVWDTGATGTSISHSLAQTLSLDQIGERRISGVTGCEICKRYLVSLHLPNGIVFPEIEVTDLSGDIGCDVLIGMDVINLGDFAVNNFMGRTTFTFRVPSIECMDFTTQLARTAVRGAFVEPSKIGRNSPCPCGSGKKFKKCCGKDIK